MKRYNPIAELLLSRLRTFCREPDAMFWTYGFPILLTIGLGLAFRSKPPDSVAVAVEDAPALKAAVETLKGDKQFQVAICSAEECRRLIRKGDATLAVMTPGNAPTVPAGSEGAAQPGSSGAMVGGGATADATYEFSYDPTRPDAALARLMVDGALQKAAGRSDSVTVADAHVTAPGSRYIDFLVPGLLGMNLMGGGLWGIGFVTVDMRIRKLIKRLVATPMKKRDFLLSLVGSRMLFTVPETLVILLTGWLIFGIAIEGSVLSIAVVSGLGALSFAGLGLLISSRAQKIETISGLMNVVMLPMWIFSGVFFSSGKFPDFLQPFIQALPLTQLNNALRAVITDGETLASQALPLGILSAYGLVSFVLALRWFRWT